MLPCMLGFRMADADRPAGFSRLSAQDRLQQASERAFVAAKIGGRALDPHPPFVAEATAEGPELQQDLVVLQRTVRIAARRRRLGDELFAVIERDRHAGDPLGREAAHEGGVLLHDDASRHAKHVLVAQPLGHDLLRAWLAFSKLPEGGGLCWSGGYWRREKA